MRLLIRWDPARQQWAVVERFVTVAVFDRLWQADAFVCAQDRQAS